MLTRILAGVVVAGLHEGRVEPTPNPLAPEKDSTISPE